MRIRLGTLRDLLWEAACCDDRKTAQQEKIAELESELAEYEAQGNELYAKYVQDELERVRSQTFLRHSPGFTRPKTESVSMTRGGRSAATDPDAQVPGHLPNELPQSASLNDENGNEIDEEAMVPGRWYGGEEPEGNDRERVGDPLGENDDLDETDARMINDELGNGIDDPNNPDQGHIAAHLRGDEDRTCLGTPPDEEMGTKALGESSGIPAWLKRDLKAFFLQEDPAVASGTSPVDPTGFYSQFDMVKDHTGTDDISATWYRSPGREPGADGDPFRVADPMNRMGFHPEKKDSTSPPAVSGEEGIDARRVPDSWPLGAGSDTSKVLGANAHPSTPEPEEGDGEDGEGSESQDGEENAEENDQAQSQEE